MPQPSLYVHLFVGHYTSFAIIVCAVLFTMVVSAQQITLKPGAIPNKEFHRGAARDFAYCEIAPVLGKPPNVMAQIQSGRVRGLSWRSGHLGGLDVARAYERSAQRRLCARRNPS